MAVIYRITKVGTDECYVGHTGMKSEYRWGQHLYLLRLGKHHAARLQQVFDEAGEAALSFEVLEECPDEDKVYREQFYIDTLNSCFNIGPAWPSKLGYKLTPEQKSRQWVNDPEAQKRAAEKRVGQQRTDEQRANMAVAQQNNLLAGQHRVGVKETPEQTERRLALAREAIAENPHIWITDGKTTKKHLASETIPDGWYQGRTISDEHMAAIIEAAGPRTEEAKATMSASATSAWQDPVKRARMLEARKPFCWITNGTDSKRHYLSEPIPEGWWKGKTLSPEHIAKMVAASKKARKREHAEPSGEALRPVDLFCPSDV